MAMIRPEPSKGIVHAWAPITTTSTNDFIGTTSIGDTMTTWSRVIPTTTTSTGGTWLTGGPMAFDPDMTDWPADDIIDHYAKDLARRRPHDHRTRHDDWWYEDGCPIP